MKYVISDIKKIILIRNQSINTHIQSLLYVIIFLSKILLNNDNFITIWSLINRVS